MRFLIDEAIDDAGDKKHAAASVLHQFISWLVTYAAYQLNISLVRDE